MNIFKRVVVTGGAGFIGSHLTEELVERGFEVIVVDNLATGKIENINHLFNKDNFKFIKGSITDLNLLREVFQGVHCVFHQAALSSVPRSLNNPTATNEVNINGTLNVLIVAKDCGVPKVVYASSSSVYGDTQELPIREDRKPNPLSPYAVSKLTGEYYCKVFSNLYEIKSISLRYFNVYGPRQDPNSEYAAVIPRFITRILNHQPPIIYGDGNQTRDFTFIKDVVKANILSMEAEAAVGTFNIASGERIGIRELADKIMEIANLKLEPIYDEPQSGDVKDSLADISEAKAQLKYQPEFSLIDGLEETIKWY